MNRKAHKAGDAEPGDVEGDHPDQQGRAQADGDPDDTEDGPQQGGRSVLLRDEVHDDHHQERMRDVVGQDRCGR
jgi:hypothetical protein